MRGYFGLGLDGIDKPMNLGAAMRTAHAFGASFVFTVAAGAAGAASAREVGLSDTSDAARNLPVYRFETAADLLLPRECELVGLEIAGDAIDLPSFRHPRCAAYVLGAERTGLSADMLARCDHVVKIPTRFSINLALAGALAMYDRTLTMGRFAPRPTRPGGPVEPLPAPRFGPPLWVAKAARRAKA